MSDNILQLLDNPSAWITVGLTVAGYWVTKYRRAWVAAASRFVVVRIRRLYSVRVSPPSPFPNGFINILSRLLPAKATSEMFEPSLDDAKADHLSRIRRCNLKGTQRLLKFCFAARVTVMIGQCLFRFVTASAWRAVRALVR